MGVPFIFFLILISVCTTTLAQDHVVDLHVQKHIVNFTGMPANALAINHQIPAPTLHFKQGDHVTLNVYNHLTIEDTAIHWHGILVPWQMDGVEGVTQKGIPPGESYSYQFTLEQSGTYWYHAHAGLQEQEGLYGAFIIDPHTPSPYTYTKDFVVVLSDWSNTRANQILANLKKSGDYYAPNFPLQPSLMRYLCESFTKDYLMMQKMRMSIYDLSDVVYDAFLLNGHSLYNPWLAEVQVGDRVRLRFINASGSTRYHIKMPDTIMEVVHVQGNDVVPYTVKDFTLGVAETLDVIVNIEHDHPSRLYAESSDKVGYIVGALVTDYQQPVCFQDIPPFPDPLPVTQEMMKFGMMHHGGGSHHDMNMAQEEHSPHSMNMSQDEHSQHNMNMSQGEHSQHNMNMPQGKKSSPQSQIDKTKYHPLRAMVPTNDPHKSVDKTIELELNGWMGRYIWFINGEPEHHAKPILFEPNKRYRLVFKNTSMMHHPMHLHGHWFILRKGLGEYDPLVHTIDIPPGATIVADVDADASGQWFFHCHILYHMLSGMSRVFQYSTLPGVCNGSLAPENEIENTVYHNRPIIRVDELCPIDPSLVNHPMAHPERFRFANFLDVGIDPFDNTQRLTFKGLYGYDYHKLELFINDAEMDHGTVENADLDIFYWHLIDQFWAIKGGVNYFDRPSQTPYWQLGVGIEGMMPYFFEVDLRGYYHAGAVKGDLEIIRNTQITNRFFIGMGIRAIAATKTQDQYILGHGLNQMRYTLTPYYRLCPGLDLVIEYEYEKAYGDFKQLLIEIGDPATQNTVTFGVSLSF